jgi:hypothetical protein
MLENEYEQLVEYLKGMIADGVQLVHDDNLMNWHDTNILSLIQEIDRKKSEAENLSVEIAEPLINRISGQRVHVIYIFDKTIDMSPSRNIVTYPKDKIWYHYRKVIPGD